MKVHVYFHQRNYLVCCSHKHSICKHTIFTSEICTLTHLKKSIWCKIAAKYFSKHNKWTTVLKKHISKKKKSPIKIKFKSPSKTMWHSTVTLTHPFFFLRRPASPSVAADCWLAVLQALERLLMLDTLSVESCRVMRPSAGDTNRINVIRLRFSSETSRLLYYFKHALETKQDYGSWQIYRKKYRDHSEG